MAKGKRLKKLRRLRDKEEEEEEMGTRRKKLEEEVPRPPTPPSSQCSLPDSPFSSSSGSRSSGDSSSQSPVMKRRKKGIALPRHPVKTRKRGRSRRVSSSSTQADGTSQAPVMADEGKQEPKKLLEPLPPKKQMRCPFFFSLYGCLYGDECNFRHFTPTLRDDDGGAFNKSSFRLSFSKANRYRGRDDEDLPAPLFPPPGWGVTITLTMEVKAYWVNRATEVFLKQIEKSSSVEIYIKDHGSDADLKSVEIVGTVERATQAFREIYELESRSSMYYSLLHEAEPLFGTPTWGFEFEDSAVEQRWPGHSIFRILVPEEIDTEACFEGFEANAGVTLKMIKGNSQNIALLCAAEHRGCRGSPGIHAVMWVFDFLVESSMLDYAGDKFSIKFLVDKDQANQFFLTRAELIESVSKRTFEVHDSDCVGLQRDLILEISGEIDDLREALSMTACFFQRFSVHSSVIPVMEELMKRSLMESTSGKTFVYSSASCSTPHKVVAEYCVDLYYAAVALVGEGGMILRQIENDTRARISLGEVKENPGELMVYIDEIHDYGVSEAEQMVKTLLYKAATRMNEIVHVFRAIYSEKVGVESTGCVGHY